MAAVAVLTMPPNSLMRVGCSIAHQGYGARRAADRIAFHFADPLTHLLHPGSVRHAPRRWRARDRQWEFVPWFAVPLRSLPLSFDPVRRTFLAKIEALDARKFNKSEFVSTSEINERAVCVIAYQAWPITRVLESDAASRNTRSSPG